MQQYLNDITTFINEHFSDSKIWNIEITSPTESTKEGMLTISNTKTLWNIDQYFFIEKEKFNKDEYELLEDTYIYKNIIIWSEY